MGLVWETVLTDENVGEIWREYLPHFLFFFFQQKGNFIEAQWPQSSGKRLPCGQGGGGGALFDLLLGAQVAGMAPLLAAVDNEGCRSVERFCRSPCRRQLVVVLGKLAEGGLHDAALQRKSQRWWTPPGYCSLRMQPSSSPLATKTRHCSSGRMPFLSWIFALRF